MPDDTVKTRMIELPATKIFPEVESKEMGELDHVVPKLEHKSTVPNFGLLPIVDTKSIDVIFEPDIPKSLYTYVMNNCGFGLNRPVMGVPVYRSVREMVDQILNQLVATGNLHWDEPDTEEGVGTWVFEGVV